jgi:hypothetical protein
MRKQAFLKRKIKMKGHPVRIFFHSSDDIACPASLPISDKSTPYQVLEIKKL